MTSRGEEPPIKSKLPNGDRPGITPNSKIPEVPSPELLREYDRVGSDLPGLILEAWANRHKRAFRYAMTALIIGGSIALSLVFGFIFLVMHGHGGYASALLGGGAIGMVAGFRSIRL
jgi:hypothetical protein